jgi:hypothetical protein
MRVGVHGCAYINVGGVWEKRKEYLCVEKRKKRRIFAKKKRYVSIKINKKDVSYNHHSGDYRHNDLFVHKRLQVTDVWRVFVRTGYYYLSIYYLCG